MRYIYLKTLAIFLFTISAQGQSFKYYLSNYPRFLGSLNDTIPYPFVGGINSPQFSRIDLNNDGVKDLFVFDRIGNKVMTFVKTGPNGQEKYIYSPQYEHLFPKMENWVQLVDFNGDGKEDIFTNSLLTANARGVAVFRNTTGNNGVLSFTKIKDPLLCLPDTIWQPGWTDTIYNYPQVGNFFINVPIITDVDDDGDIDIMSFGVGYNTLEYYMNFSQQQGFGKDSLKLRVVDRGWGYFAEGDTYDTVFLNVPQIFPKLYKQKHVSGSALLLLDTDGDGDKEMLLSNGTYSKINFLKNGRKEFNTRYDTIIRYDSIWPPSTVRAKIPYFAAAYHLDVDNDGKRDLIVASNDNFDGKETDNVMYYKNTGTDLSPVFIFNQNTLLVKDMLDLGGNSSPAFWDFDNDGDQDIFIGASGDVSVNGAFGGRIFLYENVTNKNYPVFKLKDADWLSLSAQKLRALHPAFGDINGDSKPDLLLGHAFGKIRYYQNTSSGSSLTFSLVDTAFQGISVGEYSTPQVIDLDRDGLNDLVIGEAGGNINYYRNTGTSNSPVFTLTDDTLGNIVMNEFSYAFEPPQYEITGYSFPHFCDLNGDGQYELLTGSERGYVRLFTNIEGNLAGQFTEDTAFINYLGTSQFGRYSFGRYARPGTAYLDGDTIPDIVVGNGRGGLTMLASSKGISGTIGIAPTPTKTPLLEVYPNPADNQVFLVPRKPGKPLDICIVNVVGQEVLKASYKTADDNVVLDVSRFPQGVYFIRSSSGDLAGSPVKLIIQH